jgi:8-hydroxy-5-deazaflavin:NADPH oxidoreductase
LRIAIIGYGNMGSGIAKRAVAAGYSVVLAGRDLAAAKKVAGTIGALAATPAEAVGGAELVVLATPYAAAADALAAAGDLNNRVLNGLRSDLQRRAGS